MDEDEVDEEPRGSLCFAVCALFCCPPVPHRIVSKLAFLPPKASYVFQDHDGKERMILFQDDDPPASFTPPGPLALFNLPTRRGNTIAAYLIRVTNPKYTILFSHGNAVDIGQLAVFLATLAEQLECNVFAYDYAGYGRSTGSPREANVYADVEAAAACLLNRCNIGHEQIILYGQSIGSTATVYYASKHRVAGVVLHAPLLSGLRILRPSTSRTWCCDPFKNIERIPRNENPTLVIHGTHDQVIPFSHGQTLHARTPNAVEPLWVEGAGHNDIEMYSEYPARLTKFVCEDLARSS